MDVVNVTLAFGAVVLVLIGLNTTCIWFITTRQRKRMERYVSDELVSLYNALLESPTNEGDDEE